jgi:putative ABC transport system substrate-binding protein
MKRAGWSSILAATLVLVFGVAAEAQQLKVNQIGVLVPGEAWYEIVDGLKLGLKQLGLEEGKQFTLLVRDWQGDAKTAEAAAKKLEQENVDLIYASSTGSTIAARRATADIPIVFCAGTDPVGLGLIDSFAAPGGRLTGVYYRDTDLTAKRLEILKELVPKLHRVVTFYNPRTTVAIESSKLAREAAQQMGLRLIERHYTSVAELQAGIRALKTGDADAFFAVADPVVDNQFKLIIDTAITKRLPTSFARQSFVLNGGFSSYSVSFHEVGRLSAKYVQRILSGVKPKDLPVEGVDKIELVVNLKTAKQIGLTIPPNVLARADRVIR